MGSTHNLFLLKVCRSAHIDYEEKKTGLLARDCRFSVDERLLRGSVLFQQGCARLSRKLDDLFLKMSVLQAMNNPMNDDAGLRKFKKFVDDCREEEKKS